MFSSNLLTSAIVAFLATTVSAASSPCPFNYPSELNSTESGNGLVFTVISNNPVTDNRAVQLRPNPFFPGAFFAAIDNTSSVLLSNLVDAGLYSEARNEVNQLFDLGPTGYLNERQEVNGTTQYTFGFATPDPSIIESSFFPAGEVEQDWYLLGGESDGTYSIFHQTGDEIANGFMLCEAEIDLDSGSWYQLFYYNYEQTPADFPGCEFVGVRTTVAATISNGECDIGGVVATDE